MPHIWGTGTGTDYLNEHPTAKGTPAVAHDVVAEATAEEKKVEQDAVKDDTPDKRVVESKKVLDLHLDKLLSGLHSEDQKQRKSAIRARLEKEFGPDTLGARVIHSYQDAYQPESHATKQEIEEFDRRNSAAAEMTKEHA